MTSKMKKTSKTKTTSKMMMKTTSTLETTCKMVKCNIEACIVYYLEKLLTTPDLDSHSKADPTSDILSAVRIGNRFWRNKRNRRRITHAHICKKKNIFRQRHLCITNHSLYHASFIMNHYASGLTAPVLSFFLF